jgi:hypothetical protein
MLKVGCKPRGLISVPPLNDDSLRGCTLDHLTGGEFSLGAHCPEPTQGLTKRWINTHFFGNVGRSWSKSMRQSELIRYSRIKGAGFFNHRRPSSQNFR